MMAFCAPAMAEEAPPPPYLMTGANTVTIAVTWDAESLQGLLPDGIVPADDLSGGLNVYTAEGGYGLSPYSAAYAYINVKGWDAVGGGAARYILGGWYGPDPKVAAAMRTHFFAEVGAGESSQSEDGDTWTGTGGDGQGSITLTVKPGGDCIAAAGTLNYVGVAGGGVGLDLLQIPFVGDFCPAEPVSVDITGPEGSALAQIAVDKMLGGGRLRSGAFAFTK
jgi:hypothetical protein